ncbi:LysR substrate-binding domain-containing protein [Psychrobacter alimentarius]|uniref:LysR substrate-binding domain-containing protein n=1 Tax=Psychrobacter alimentarius TaxID=261164 RepID=UPI003FD36CD6
MQPSSTVKPLIESGQLIELLPEWQPKTLGVYVVYANRKQVTPLQRQFIDFLIEAIKRSPHW